MRSFISGFHPKGDFLASGIGSRWNTLSMNP
jgi:hypothetical protein